MDEELYSYYAYAVRFNLKDKYEKVSDEILELINAGKDIPNSVAKDLLNTMDFTDMPYADKMASKCLYITSQAVEYFKNYKRKKYLFQGVRKVKIGAKITKRHYTLHNLFYDPIRDYFRLKESQGEIEAKSALIHFYNSIKAYRNLMFTRSHKKDCSHFRVTVMSVFLLYKVESEMYSHKKLDVETMFTFGNNQLKSVKEIWVKK